jgi:hypothetical protein
MKKEGIWTLPPVTADDIVELFVSKSVWHGNYKKQFPRVRQFPIVEAWLEQEDEAPADADVWNEVKCLYTFADLKDLLDMKEKKGKRKADNSDKGKKSHKKSKKTSKDSDSD